MTHKITIIGAGNVATHLASAFSAFKGVEINIYSRTFQKAEALALMTNAKALEKLSDISPDTDLVLIATTDSSVSDVAAEISRINGIVAHTSGSVPLGILSAHHARAGVFYPLQSFTASEKVNFKDIPIFLEATDSETLQTLHETATLISNNVYEADSARRAKLHIAGVLTNNFTTALMGYTEEILKSEGLPLTTVRPLAEMTLKKSFSIGPQAAMTGPAKRGDLDTIKKQLDAIHDPDLKNIYTTLTQAILNKFSPNEH